MVSFDEALNPSNQSEHLLKKRLETRWASLTVVARDLEKHYTKTWDEGATMNNSIHRDAYYMTKKSIALTSCAVANKDVPVTRIEQNQNLGILKLNLSRQNPFHYAYNFESN